MVEDSKGVQIREAADTAREAWRTVYEQITAHVPSASHYEQLNSTLQDFNTGLLASLELLSSVDTQKSKIDVAQFVSLQQSLLGNLNNITTRISDLQGWLSDANIKSADNLSFISNNKGDRNVLDDLTKIRAQVEGALKSLGPLSLLIRLGKPGNLGKRAEALDELRSEAEQLVTQIQGTLKRVDELKASIETTTGHINDSRTAAQNIVKELEELLKTAGQHNAQIEAAFRKIDETLKNAGDVAQQVKSYEEQFKDFENKLQERLKLFAQFENDVKTAEDENKKREHKIDELIERSESMITGATVAGLSSEFSNTADTYRKRRRFATVFFCAAIVLLALAILPVALYLLPITPAETESLSWFTRILFTEDIKPLGWISRVVIVVPFVWLTTFAHSLFRESSTLYNTYKFKATLAQSVDGFKKEAPGYEQEIAAAVFMDIREKPVYKGDDNEGPSNQALEFLLKKMRSKDES